MAFALTETEPSSESLQ